MTVTRPIRERLADVITQEFKCQIASAAEAIGIGVNALNSYVNRNEKLPDPEFARVSRWLLRYEGSKRLSPTPYASAVMPQPSEEEPNVIGFERDGVVVPLPTAKDIIFAQIMAMERRVEALEEQDRQNKVKIGELELRIHEVVTKRIASMFRAIAEGLKEDGD